MSWETEIEDKLSEIFQEVFNKGKDFEEAPETFIPLRWSYEDGPAPDVDFVLFNTFAIQNIGLPYRSNVIEVPAPTLLDPNAVKYIQTSEITKSFTLNFQAVGKTSKDLCLQMKDALLDNDIIDFIFTKNLSISDSTEIEDITAIDDSIEKRYSFDIMFLAAIATEKEIPFVETADLTGEFETPDNGIIDVEVDPKYN